MHTRELVNFLQGLAENNNRAWFVMNKPSYDILRGEFVELVGAVIAETAKFDPPIAGQDAKKALFRINRDIRFAKDKSPYKSNFSAVIAPGGKKDPGSHYYFHIDHKGELFVAGGCYMPPSNVLAQIRRHIVQEPAKFSRLLKTRTIWSHFGSFADAGKLTRPPKGFSADSPHMDYIKQKSFIVWAETPALKISSAALAKHIAGGFRKSYPLVTWLRDAVR